MAEYKTCTNPECLKTKPVSEFAKDKQKKDGLYSRCKECVNSYMRKLSETVDRKQKKRGYNTTPEAIEKRRAYDNTEERKEFHRALSLTREAKDARKIYLSKKFKEDPAFKISHYLRVRLRKVLKRKTKRGSAVSFLGCSPEQAVSHIESLFIPGMTWENHGEWHIDHKMPLASFDLEDPDQLAKACHYTNLQPLWAFDNMSKADKVMWAGNLSKQELITRGVI